MKKTLLLALLLGFNAESTASIHNEIKGAEIEPLVRYEHPEARKRKERMPLPFGKSISTIDMYILNSEGIEGAIRPSGIVYGFDRNPEDGKKTVEYEFIIRDCDKNKEVKVYAVYDVPHKLLYVDSSRDRHINYVVKGIESILGIKLPMIPTKCEDETT